MQSAKCCLFDRIALRTTHNYCKYLCDKHHFARLLQNRLVNSALGADIRKKLKLTNVELF